MKYDAKIDTWSFPPGYSTEKWNPGERPIVITNTVFDGNSLGRWIYDWSVYAYGCCCPMSNLAGDLWLVLIEFMGHFKFACSHANAIEDEDTLEMVSDFLASAERLWIRLKAIIKECENAMVYAQERMSANPIPLAMTGVPGCAFVRTLLDPNCQLHETERLVTGMRLWIVRFKANCASVFATR